MYRHIRHEDQQINCSEALSILRHFVRNEKQNANSLSIVLRSAEATRSISEVTRRAVRFGRARQLTYHHLKLDICLLGCHQSQHDFRSRPGYGAPTRTRTADLLITNQLLYQLSYRGLATSLRKKCAMSKGQLRSLLSLFSMMSHG